MYLWNQIPNEIPTEVSENFVSGFFVSKSVAD